MPKAKYQFEDFLATVNDAYIGFASAIHGALVQEGYKPKIQSTKSYGLHAAYWQPKIKSVAGIIAYLLTRDGKLKIRINTDNHAKYHDVLSRLPQNIVSQIDKAVNCLKSIDPQKCWQGCTGYDFSIAGKRYYKCIVNCFLLDVDYESRGRKNGA